MPDENQQPDPPRTNGPSVRVPLPKPFRHAIEQAAGVFRQEFPIPDRKQAERAGRVFARALYPAPRRGRPQHSDVTRALRLEAEGKSRKEIYRALAKNTHEKQHALSQAMRHRKMREKRRAERDKSRTPFVTPTN
jgi:hypothetical protein